MGRKYFPNRWFEDAQVGEEATIAHGQGLGGWGMTPARENESEDGRYVLVGQSQEVRRLKQQHHQLRSQLKAVFPSGQSGPWF